MPGLRNLGWHNIIVFGEDVGKGKEVIITTNRGEYNIFLFDKVSENGTI